MQTKYCLLCSVHLVTYSNPEQITTVYTVKECNMHVNVIHYTPVYV
jgi:hypothetical protein